MKCKNCPAKGEEGKECKAGIIPPTQRSGEKGCGANMVTVLSWLRQMASIQKNGNGGHHS